MPSKSFKDDSRDPPMFLDRFRVDQDVIEIDANDSFHDEVLKDVVHHHLEGGGGVCETKKHH